MQEHLQQTLEVNGLPTGLAFLIVRALDEATILQLVGVIDAYDPEEDFELRK